MNQNNENIGLKNSIIWQDVESNSVSISGEEKIIPEKYRILKLDLKALKAFFEKIPLEKTENAKTNPVEIELPLPDGSRLNFKAIETQMMAPELAKKFPEIKTYSGQGISESTARATFDVNENNFHGLINYSKGTVYIDPLSRRNNEFYICYFKKDLPIKNRPKFFEIVLDKI